MVLAYIGVERSQEPLARSMGLVENLGVPASRILRLQADRLRVEYYAEGSLQDLHRWLSRRIPVIACVQTGHFSYWQGHPTQHAVVVVETDLQTTYCLDPSRDSTVIAIPIDEFVLAWDELAMAFAVIFVR
jgi:hypothetical protein